jgi:dephospho-CoA kinase
MKVIGITGMPGSGKSIVSRIAEEMGFGVTRMGDIIREEAKKRDKPSGKVAVELREEFGNFVVANRSIEKISETAENTLNPDFFVIEGIRSPYEVNIFRERFPSFKVIAVHSTPKTRYHRLKNRMRDDDSDKKYKFKNRDKRELQFGIGEVISTADFMVVNEGSLKKFKSILRSILKNEM